MTVTESEVIRMFNKLESIKGTAKELGLSEQMVRKILIGAGTYRTKYSDKIKTMKLLGKSSKEIAAELHISVQSVWAHSPYEKCCSLHPPTANALRIKKSRAKKQGGK